MSIDNGSASRARSTPNVSKSVGNLAYCAIELGELQMELLKVDSCEAARKARSSLVMTAIGLVLLLASLPVALFAVAEALVEFADWPRAAALATSAGGALVLCLLFAIVGGWKLRQSLTTWQRSSEEFGRNVAWLKSALRGNAYTTGEPSEEPVPETMSR